MRKQYTSTEKYTFFEKIQLYRKYILTLFIKNCKNILFKKQEHIMIDFSKMMCSTFLLLIFVNQDFYNTKLNI